MTREEAIRILKECKERKLKYTFYTLDEYQAATDMAINVLEQQPCDEYGNYKYPSDVELTDPNTATSMPCGDAISRQAALDDSGLGEFHRYDDYCKMRNYIKSLPPVTPQQNCEDIAKAFQFGMALGFGEKHDEMDKVMEEVKKVITPQPKTGRWITTRTFMHDGEYYCDKCKCDAPNNEKWDFCPNCGAKMQEVEE